MPHSLALIETMAQQFGVLSEPARLKILASLCGGEMCVSDLLLSTGLSQTNASRHLGLMYQAGVLFKRREGNHVFYKVANMLYVDLCFLVMKQSQENPLSPAQAF
ncbi:metalloregulator ArsR/SmtB family transcription factor [Hydrogenophaga sp.]|uniref:ArsR/SmtB family transcription factor n=1 Tax=Hydrogenophaga sp. TaxID=1904254 RepID=UPI003420CC46